MTARAATDIVPVEYAVAVDRYLAEAELGPASRRVYRISLASWAWPLVGKLPPAGLSRRKRPRARGCRPAGASAPVKRHPSEGRFRYQSPEPASISNTVYGRRGPTSSMLTTAPDGTSGRILPANSSAWSALFAPTTRNRQRRTTE